MKDLAIIGGTGLQQLTGFTLEQEKHFKTPFGIPSGPLLKGNVKGIPITFLARHGNPHLIPPHRINYRANIWSLKETGIEQIIAIAAVGGISKEMYPSRIAIPNQIIDYSYQRKHTFFEEDLEHVTHIDFTNPYSLALRDKLLNVAKNINLDICKQGTYGCTQGPRLETAAEIAKIESDGCDMVGMTGMPEAALARELGLNYASCAVVANWAAGKSANEITMTEIEQNLRLGMADVEKLILAIITGA